MGTPLNFGIEFEFVGMGNSNRNIGNRLHEAINQNRKDMEQIAFSCGGNSEFWCVKGDCSVNRTDVCLSPNRYGDGCGTCNRCVYPGGAELVSPVLTYNDDGLMQVYRVCEALAACGAFANETCGLHVHMDARWLQRYDRSFAQDFLNFMAKSYADDEDIFDSFVHESRRGNKNEYCRTLKGITDYSRIPRYHKLNIQAFARHGTIEFRQHHGTISHDEVLPWVHMCAKYYTTKRAEFLLNAAENRKYRYSSHYIQEDFSILL